MSNPNKMAEVPTHSPEGFTLENASVTTAKKPNPKMWACSGQGNDFFPCERTVNILPAGQYTIRYSDGNGIYFSKKEINLDELLVLPDSKSEEVLKDIKDFCGRREIFKQFGFLWKRGVLLYGPPGGGKTSTVQQISKMIIDQGGVTFYCTDPNLDAEGLSLFRNIEKTRPIVVIIEDIDAIIKHYGESNLLALLDGELQIDNVIFIATTNYLEELDKRIKNRPSRFDDLIKIDFPSNSARRLFIETKNPRLKKEENKKELEDWVKITDGFSIAHLKEVIVSVECLGKELEPTIERLKRMIYDNPKSDDDNQNRGMGFVKKS